MTTPYLTVTVDCDNDAVELSQGDYSTDHLTSIRLKVSHPTKVLAVLENLLHLLDASNVTLQTQAVGQLHHIAEW